MYMYIMIIQSYLRVYIKILARSQFIVFNSFHSFPVIHFCESKQMTAKILLIRLDIDGLQKFVGLVTYIEGKAKRFK